MPFYKCKYIDANKRKVTAIREADNIYILQALLAQEGCTVLSADLIKEKKKNTFFAISSKVKPTEVILFLKQFSVMINAGATIADSLESLKNQHHSAAFSRVLQEVNEDVVTGVPLSEALGKHPKVFPAYFQNMVAIGENSGSLNRVLSALADYYERELKMKRKAKAALVYPIFLLIMVFVVVLFMCFFIVPEFEGIIDELGGNVPVFTQVILNISKFVRENWMFLFVGIAAVVLLVVVFFRTKAGKTVKDAARLRLPFLRTINKELITTRFTQAFIILLDSGMTISSCMTNLKRMLENQALMNRFDDVIAQIDRGVGISAALASLKFFPDILIDMVRVGEESGDLVSVLKSTSSYFESRVEAAISRATSALEPIMIIILGVIVGGVILAVFLPLLSIMNTISA